MPKNIYPKHIIDVIRRMVSSGSSNKEIAMAIGTTERRLQARISQLGITREPDNRLCNSIAIRVPIKVVAGFADAAQCRDIQPQNLVRLVLTRVAEDNLFTAILDDGK